MSLNDLVSVSITAATLSPTVPGFGTPLIAAFHTHYVDRVRTYSSLAGMVSDGFAVTEAAYLAAQAIFAQNPAVQNIKVGRKLLATTQTLTLKVLDAVQGDVIKFNVGGLENGMTAISYTIPGAATTITVATAIAALMGAVDDVTAASSGTDTISFHHTDGAGAFLDVSGWNPNQLALSDTSTDPGVATDLAQLALIDNDWYGLVLDSNSSAEALAAAAWVESNLKLFTPTNSDAANFNSGSTTDLAAELQSHSYTRTGMLYSGSQLMCYNGAGWMGNRFSDSQPGDDTWAYKQIAGGPADTAKAQTMSPTIRTNILAKNGNVYETVSGVAITEFGKSGAGEFLDIVRFIDWLRAQIQARVFSLLINNKKIPFTDAGVDLIRSTVLGALTDGVNAGGLVKGTTSCTAPAVADVASTDKANRNVPGVKFSGQLAGAIHTLVINGTLTL